MANFWFVCAVLFLALFGLILLVALIDWRVRRIVVRMLWEHRIFERLEREAHDAIHHDQTTEDHA